MADESSSVPLYVLDAFTNKAFGGNPAAVCLVGCKELSNDFMQKIAREMNHSDTAFVKLMNTEDTYTKGSLFGLRWFTPTCEVPLCGHATLASAAVLLNSLGNLNSEITFETVSGKLMARKEGTASICLNFPLNESKPVSEEDQAVTRLIKAVTGDLPLQEVRYSKKTKMFIFVLQPSLTRQDLENLAPDFQAMLSALSSEIAGDVLVTLQGTKSNGCVDDRGEVYDFVSRCFTSWVGVPEDPVTGSAHTVLASYWSSKLEKTQLYARQCSSRGGELTVRVRQDGRVDIIGRAVLVLQGTLHL